MAKTMASIQMDFNRTIKKANELNDMAEKIEKQMTGSFEENLQLVRKAWSGEAAEQYLNKGQQLTEKLKNNALQLRKIAEAMKKAAKVTYDAEQQAILLAQARKG